MPARRDKTAERAWQGSPVAKRRLQNSNRNPRHPSDGQQQRWNLLDIFDLPEQKEQKERKERRVELVAEVNGGAAAAQSDAAGGALKKARGVTAERGSKKKRGPHRRCGDTVRDVDASSQAVGRIRLMPTDS